MDTISDDEFLYFGSMLTNFAYHSGSIHLSHFDSVNELQFHSLNNEFIQHSTTSIPMDIEAKQLILPCMPTNFIEIPTLGDNLKSINDDFCRPLIKTELSSRLKGIISGVRSALIKCNSTKWYRLKGCGDNTDGFSIKPISQSDTKLTIRGCAFLHTTHRELFMTYYISQLLAPHKIQCANSSVGWFEYKLENETFDNIITSDIPIVQDKNINQWPNTLRCCILMETLGNKRLSDHVLFGIEQLLCMIISHDKTHPVNQSNLISLFPSERLTKSDENNEKLIPLSTWFALLTNILQPVDYLKSNWLHSSSYLSEEVPADMDGDQWRNLWKVNILILNKYLQTKQPLSDLLCLLYKRFGFECGSILGLMHYHRISWGTYKDELGMHCNAHPNNLVIKLSTPASSFLLAPLDFDMSFTETGYLPNIYNNQLFDEIIKLELSAFQLTLGGDSQASSGVTVWVEMPDNEWTSARWLLRDIMLNEFNRVYLETIQNGSTIKTSESFSNEQNNAVQSLIRLALMKTMKEIG
ncbi:unnamed protein product [Rotaria socialis]|uniref:Uncharacterized protein n=1 Tax=Rotaria socialis TaxID=392032 RepID=A0A817UU08_9BILA|nr:unnamed protein product [Rotaria socialis]CAF3448910.1 unnamed protein product [Rotaria socialis]CAF4336751.1 unnamed protein product [Rotaria socialis]CAF4851377.1 unnamed protein product [Rotaria socialis]